MTAYSLCQNIIIDCLLRFLLHKTPAYNAPSEKLISKQNR